MCGTHLQCQAAVLGLGFLALESILCPHALGVDELAFPWLDVAIQVGDELVLLMAHSCPEVSDAQVGLLAITEVRLGDQDVPHRKHAEPTNFLW